MQGINVLSLFDGISCGQVALERAGIKVAKYYASEIDKHAIKVTQKNYPQTIQLGDVQKINFVPDIDLLIGGSPCQNLSSAGNGEGLEGEKSKLFWEYVRIFKIVKPKYFLLENVASMKKTDKEVITSVMGVEPVLINSTLVSAQNRERLYWTNIPDLRQPEDKQIFLKDIVESGYVDRDKSYCIDANYFKAGDLKSYFEKHRKQLIFELSKDATHVFVCRENGRRLTPDGLKRDDINGEISRGYEINFSGKSGTLTTVLKDNYLIENLIVRKLTPIECERLQTLPENYTEGISNSQRYKTIGNGWTVDVIAHILSHIEIGQVAKPEIYGVAI